MTGNLQKLNPVFREISTKLGINNHTSAHCRREVEIWHWYYRAFEEVAKRSFRSVLRSPQASRDFSLKPGRLLWRYRELSSDR